LIFDKSYIGYDIYSWLNNSKIKNKKSTNSNYTYTVYSRIIPKFAKVKKKEISLEIINNFTNDLLNEGLAPKSVKDILIILQQILKIGGINIKIPMPKVPKSNIQILQSEEQQQLEIELLKNMDTVKFGIYFCLYSGLRIGELCALQWKNIDLKDKKIYVKQTLVRIKNSNLSSNKKTIIIIKFFCGLRTVCVTLRLIQYKCSLDILYIANFFEKLSFFIIKSIFLRKRSFRLKFFASFF